MGLDYAEKNYTFENKDEWFAQDKEKLGLAFPNIPYFVDTDGYCLTESFAIH